MFLSAGGRSESKERVEGGGDAISSPGFARKLLQRPSNFPNVAHFFHDEKLSPRLVATLHFGGEHHRIIAPGFPFDNTDRSYADDFIHKPDGSFVRSFVLEVFFHHFLQLAGETGSQ